MLSLSVNAKFAVTIKIINQTNDTIKAFVDISDNVGSNSNNLVTQEILPRKDYSVEINVDKYSVLTGYGTFKKGGKSSEKYRMIMKKNDLFSVVVAMPDDGSNKSLTELTSSSNILEYDPKKFLVNDVTPKPIEALFSQYLGGLVAYIDSGNKKIPITTISPTDLKTRMKLIFGTSTASKEVNFINQNVQNITGSIPTIAQIGINWDNSSLYNVKIEFNKIGVIDYQSNGVNLATALNNLNNDERYNLGYLKAIHPSLKLRQINQAYVFEAVYIEINQGSSLGMSNEINASTFFTNKGNFKISRTSMDKKVFGNSYLGFWFTDASQDLTGSLNYALAFYYSVTNNTLAVKNDNDVIKDYNDLRKTNHTLPIFQNKQEILNFFSMQVDQFKNSNPDFKKDNLLQSIRVDMQDPVNKMSDIELKNTYEKLKLNNSGLPNTYDPNAAKLYIKILNDEK